MIEILFSAEDFTTDITDNTDKGKKIHLHVFCPFDFILIRSIRAIRVIRGK